VRYVFGLRFEVIEVDGVVSLRTQSGWFEVLI
jgi:hypothetical protein